MASEIRDHGHGEHNGSAGAPTRRNGTSSKPTTLLINGSAGSAPPVRGGAQTQTQAQAGMEFPDSDDAGSDEARSDLAVLSPSSVTSPPYWSSHTHQRLPSNMSAESVLPPGAITLQDNECDDGPDGANIYGRDRNRACWAKSVQVRDYVLVNGSTANIGAFAVWNIRVETLNVRHPVRTMG